LNKRANSGFGFLFLRFAISGDALQPLRPLLFSHVQQDVPLRWLDLLNVRQAVGIAFAGEAVVKHARRQPAVELSQEAIADQVGTFHVSTLPLWIRKRTSPKACCACCAMLHLPQHPKPTATQLLSASCCVVASVSK
jgi:hypothetical protein